MAESVLDWDSYIKEAQGSYETGITLIQDMSGWDKIQTKNEDVVCMKRLQEEESIAALKAEFYVDKSAEQISRYLYDNWLEINAEMQGKDFGGAESIGKHSDDVGLLRMRLKPKGPVSPREMQFVWVYLSLGEGTFAIAGRSVDTGIAPAADHVLGEFKTYLMTFEPVAGNSNRCHYTMVGHVDPKGNIPAVIINKIIGKRAAFYEGLKARCEAL